MAKNPVQDSIERLKQKARNIDLYHMVAIIAIHLGSDLTDPKGTTGNYYYYFMFENKKFKVEYISTEIPVDDKHIGFCRIEATYKGKIVFSEIGGNVIFYNPGKWLQELKILYKKALIKKNQSTQRENIKNV